MKPKHLLLGTLAILAITATTTTTAAMAEGPFWHVAGVKLTGSSKKITLKGGAGRLHATIGGLKTEIECATNSGKGEISNGTEQGEDAGVVTFETPCHVFEETTSQTRGPEICELTANIKTNQVKSYLWYHQTTQTPGGRTSQFQVKFAPATGQTFAEFELPSTCHSIANVNVIAKGTAAAEIKPERSEAEKGQLIFPTQWQSHLWRPTSGQGTLETQVQLIVNGTPARIEGTDSVELEGGGNFGVFDH